ncbi:unnamed protein product [Polarella glacialis]|uniref:Uncharacterized protein n=1 Tax=Polarella glacialis TaxID=89957 RepID=A0A813DHC2_POLGL|nr:unnamed protein product [Polarella glacialis]
MRLPSWQPSSPCQAVIPKCQRLHGSLKRSSAELLRDWARANHFVREALQQAPAVPDTLFEPAPNHICGDCKSRNDLAPLNPKCLQASCRPRGYSRTVPVYVAL